MLYYSCANKKEVISLPEETKKLADDFSKMYNRLNEKGKLYMNGVITGMAAANDLDAAHKTEDEAEKKGA